MLSRWHRGQTKGEHKSATVPFAALLAGGHFGLRMLWCFMDHQTTVATILEFPAVAEAWIAPHTRRCTADDIEFHSLKLLQHLANASCEPVTLWPSQNYGPRWAGRDAWVTHGDGLTRQIECCQQCNAADDAAATALPRESR
jgi:hypothetical protein